MELRNSQHNYGFIARFLHWGMALTIFAMFALGLWMRSLDYYSPWYKSAPDIHKSVGILLLMALLFRFIWRLANVRPEDGYLKPFERTISHIVHWAFYLLLLVHMSTGYLISTVDGRAISVFGWFDVPSIYEQKGLEEMVGFIHEYLSYSLMALAALHIAAALKHHFVDGDVTLQRMLFASNSNATPSKGQSKGHPT